jgi:hypothetical protein
MATFEQRQKVLYDEYLEKKWGKLCENHNGMPNIKDEKMRKEMALLLENSTVPYTESMMDGTTITTANSEVTVTAGNMVPRVLPPIIRRLYPSLMIRDLVSVQPIPTPECKVFFKNTMLTGTATEVPNYTAAGRACATANSYSSSTTEATDDIPTITFQLATQAVTAGKKKLKAVWSKELEQDLNTYVGLSAQSESIADIATQIGLELEYSVISHLISSATAGNTDWHYTVASGTAQTEKKAWDQTLCEAFIDADTDVFEKKFVKTNWVVCDTRTAARLRKLSNFVLDPSFDPRRSSLKRNVIGVLNAQWTIIEDPWFFSSQALLGYKNPDNEYHAGFVFAPYILAYMTKPFENPNTLTTTIGFMSRFATAMLDGDMYSTVTIQA